MMLTLVFVQCGHDEEEELNDKSLFQTMWEGTFTDENDKEYQVLIEFSSKDAGGYYYKTDKDQSFKYSHSFFYEFDGKIVLIGRINDDLLTGYWWITDYNGKEMTLLRNAEASNECVLKLKKVI